MRASVVQPAAVRQVILKDWRLYRNLIGGSILGGAVGIAMVLRATETTVVVGAVWFFISLVLMATMLPLVGIAGERKNHTLAFLMSLPISGVQYARAKLWASLGMFLAPWLAFVAAALLVVEVRGLFPQGIIPMMLILLLMPFVGFSVLTAVSLVAESEGASIAANVAVQSSWWLAWFFVSQIPGLMEHVKEPRAVWNRPVFEVIGVEVALTVAVLSLGLYLQSRKHDFV